MMTIDRLFMGALFIIGWFGFIDFSFRRRPNHLLSGVGWASLIGVPTVVFRDAATGLLIPTAVLSAILYILLRRRMKPELRPESVLLFFGDKVSIAVSGAMAALTLGLFLFAAGLLDQPEDWRGAHAWVVVACPLVLGAATGLARQALRKKYPEPTSIGLIYGSGGSQMVGWRPMATRPMMPAGFWWDELIMSAVLTPILWPLLSSAFAVWGLVFLLGMCVLPTLIFYMTWSTLHTTFLRWFGTVDRKAQMQYEAYDVLVTDDTVGPYLGKITVTYEEPINRFVVEGMLPQRYHVETIRRRLREIHGGEVDTTNVTIDPELLPTPWFELALARRDKRKKSEAASKT